MFVYNVTKKRQKSESKYVFTFNVKMKRLFVRV